MLTAQDVMLLASDVVATEVANNTGCHVVDKLIEWKPPNSIFVVTNNTGCHVVGI
ncbi:MAG: hypothetical protein ACKPGB_21420 [Dolichospermum sp.]